MQNSDGDDEDTYMSKIFVCLIVHEFGDSIELFSHKFESSQTAVNQVFQTIISLFVWISEVWSVQYLELNTTASTAIGPMMCGTWSNG